MNRPSLLATASAAFLFAFFSLFSRFASGEVETVCPIAKAQDIVDCALKRHPEIISAESVLTRDGRLLEIAKQRPNPEIDSKILGGTSADDSFLTTETSLFTVWELGGKRRARIGQASATLEALQPELQGKRERILLRTILTMYRLRQISGELSHTQETIATFAKIHGLYRARPFLTPEQEVSLSSFELAGEDYKLKRSQLIQEQHNLLGELQIATEVPWSVLRQHLPSEKRNWPKLGAENSPENFKNSTLEAARSEQNLADKNLKIAQAKAWPDLRIGPTLETESLSKSAKVTGGVHFTLPLPLINRNQGEKNYARSDIERTKTELQLALRQTAIERQLLLTRYVGALKALSQTPSLGGLSSAHAKIEAFFEKGLVPSTLVIEAHRQINEIVKTRNEREITAIEAMWRIYIIEGRAFSEKV